MVPIWRGTDAWKDEELYQIVTVLEHICDVSWSIIVSDVSSYLHFVVVITAVVDVVVDVSVVVVGLNKTATMCDSLIPVLSFSTSSTYYMLSFYCSCSNSNSSSDYCCSYNYNSSGTHAVKVVVRSGSRVVVRP